jgi:heme/copper-type cytochrome/quinol oxidase subunit 2
MKVNQIEGRQMTKHSKITVLCAVVALGLALHLSLGSEVFAASGVGNLVTGGAATGNNAAATNQTVQSLIPTIVNTFLFIVGLLYVIMLVYGGIQYTTSAGDQSKVTKAKQTVTYSIVGLVVSILAFAIVSFVVDNIGSGGGSGGNSTTNNATNNTTNP